MKDVEELRNLLKNTPILLEYAEKRLEKGLNPQTLSEMRSFVMSAQFFTIKARQIIEEEIKKIGKSAKSQSTME